jgi:PAS domain S-box-containing protein
MLMAAMIAGLGLRAEQSVSRAGDVGAAAFGQALTTTSLAHTAEASVAAIDAALQRRRLAPTSTARQLEEERIAGLAKRVADNLRTVTERAASDAVRQAAAGADAATVAWMDAARATYRQPSPDWTRLTALAGTARERFEALIELIVEDTLRQGEEAHAAVLAARRATLAATAGALLFGCVAVLWLARRVAGPLAAASRAASGIAAGRLDTPIPEGGVGGEFGALLEALGRARDSLRAGIMREKQAGLDAQARLVEAMEVSTEGFVLTDATGRITAANRRAAKLLADLALAPGEDWDRAASSLHVPDPAMAAALWHAPPAAAEVKLPDGRWLRLSRSPARDGGAVAILSDITRRKAQEAALSESNRRFSAAIGNMAQGLCMVDAECRILVCNQRFCDMFGLARPERVAGMSARDASRIAVEAARYPRDLLARIEEDLRSLQGRSESLSVVREGAGGAALAIAYEPMRGGGWVATYADVSEQRAAEERQALLMRELDHRAKNALAVVQAALRLTPKDDVESYARAVGGRVGALARAHTLLAKGQWSGAELRDLAWGELTPFLGSASAAADKRRQQPRAALDGPDVTLVPGAAQAISMALHELATNATKHGALSTPEGRVSVIWETDAEKGKLRLLWAEAGGPPVEAPPTRRGFGSRLLEATLKDQLGGTPARDWRPGGLVCTIELPLARALAGQARRRPIRTGLEPDFVPTGAGMVAPAALAAVCAT